MVWKKFFLILFWTTLPLTIACLILSLNMIWPTLLQKTEDIKSPSQNANNVATSKVSTDEVFNSVTFNSYKYRQTMDSLNIHVRMEYLEYLTSRHDWDSRYSQKHCKIELKLPIINVFVSESLTDNCYSYDSCVNHKLMTYVPVVWDVTFNFLITGDGEIFEGLSWKCKVDDPLIDPDCIHVVLTGNSNFSSSQITDKQYRSLKLLIDANVVEGTISPVSALIPICCLVEQQNPGKQVYQKLSEFNTFMTGCDIFCL